MATNVAADTSEESNLHACANHLVSSGNRRFGDFSILHQFGKRPLLEFVCQFFGGSFHCGFAHAVQIGSNGKRLFLRVHLLKWLASPSGNLPFKSLEWRLTAKVFSPNNLTHVGIHTCAIVDKRTASRDQSRTKEGTHVGNALRPVRILGSRFLPFHLPVINGIEDVGVSIRCNLRDDAKIYPGSGSCPFEVQRRKVVKVALNSSTQTSRQSRTGGRDKSFCPLRYDVSRCLREPR